MTIPENFHFSQDSLQKFLFCRRRFFLQFIQKLQWPAVETEPILENEVWLRKGTFFHRCIQQYFVGISEEKISSSIEDDEVSNWWKEFKKSLPNLPGITDTNTRKYPEQILVSRFGEYRLIAKYDLIVNYPNGDAIIYDWKTSRKKPKKPWLAERIQTYLYPYMLISSGTQLNPSGPPITKNIKMIYWFPTFPDDPQVFQLTEKVFSRNEKYLHDLIQQIGDLAEYNDIEKFPQTDDLKKCTYCQYRSFCETGIKAAALPDEEWDENYNQVDFDFDQITEIEIS